MKLIDDMTHWMLGALVAGCSLRVAYCMIKAAADADEAAMYKKRALNAVKFLIIGSCLWAIKGIVFYYYA